MVEGVLDGGSVCFLLCVMNKTSHCQRNLFSLAVGDVVRHIIFLSVDGESFFT